MIISRTPLRVSFCGGGTDLDDFARIEPNGGRVVSIAIDKYVYVTLNRRFDEKIRDQAPVSGCTCVGEICFDLFFHDGRYEKVVSMTAVVFFFVFF